MPDAFIDRYMAGEREQVWQELYALGPSIAASDKLLKDARAVARETMNRVRQNVERILQRLQKIGYLFDCLGDPPPDNRPYQPPKRAIKADLEKIERMVGAIPISVRAWMEFVGTVNFMGNLPGIRGKNAHVNWLGGKGCPDPLVFQYPFDFFESEYKNWVRQKKEGYKELFTLDFAPDDLHKAHISGGSPYRVYLPNPSADALVIGEWHKTTFISYLRHVFQWGGFPGFSRMRKFSAKRPDVLDRLCDGLLPI